MKHNVIDTLDYIAAKARHAGMHVESYEGIKSYPELNLPEQIERVAYEIETNVEVQRSCCLTVMPEIPVADMIPLRMVSIYAIPGALWKSR